MNIGFKKLALTFTYKYYSQNLKVTNTKYYRFLPVVSCVVPQDMNTSSSASFPVSVTDGTSQHPQIASQNPQTTSEYFVVKRFRLPRSVASLFPVHCSTPGVKSGRRVWTIFAREERGFSSWSLSSGGELSPVTRSSSHTWMTTLGVVGVAVCSSYVSPKGHTEKCSQRSGRCT